MRSTTNLPYAAKTAHTRIRPVNGEGRRDRGPPRSSLLTIVGNKEEMFSMCGIAHRRSATSSRLLFRRVMRTGLVRSLPRHSEIFISNTSGGFCRRRNRLSGRKSWCESDDSDSLAKAAKMAEAKYAERLFHRR